MGRCHLRGPRPLSASWSAVQHRAADVVQRGGGRGRQAHHEDGRVDRVQRGGVRRGGGAQRGARLRPLVPRQRREQPHGLVGAGLVRRRVGDLLQLRAEVRERQRAPLGVEHVHLVEGRALLHHHVPRALEGLQRVTLSAGQPRGAEEVGVLRHVERVRAGGGRAVEGDAARQQAHHLIEGRRLRPLWLRVEEVGLEVAALQRAQEGHRRVHEPRGAPDL